MNNKPHRDEIEEQRMNDNHVEAPVGMGIVAATAIGGFVCMAVGIAAGKDVVLAVIGFSAGCARRGVP